MSDVDFTSIRPGIGQAQGTVQTLTTVLSAFQPVLAAPPAGSLNIGFTRINLLWIPGVAPAVPNDGYQIVFGPNTAAIVAGSFTGSPIFTAAMGIQSWLLMPTDTGFKVQNTVSGTNNLYWWIG